MKLVPSWVTLLPWIFTAAGLAPFVFYEARPSSLEGGLVHLVAALMLAGCASLYLRASLPQPVRLAWGLGLGWLAGGSSLSAASMLLDLGPAAAQLSVAESLARALAVLSFLAALRTLYALEYRPIQPLLEPRYLDARTRTMNRRALEALSDSLERLAPRRPVMLILIELKAHAHGKVRDLIRRPDLVFYLGADRFLIVLQDATPEAALRVRERLEAHLGHPRMCVLPFRGGDLRHALTQLQAELGV